VPAVAAQLDVVAVRPSTRLEHEDQLVLRKRSDEAHLPA
jgi:hypothetical protein